jgi:hypothetical protein
MRMIGWLMFATVVATTPLDGQQQLRLRTELVATSGYVWRGITRHRYPVVQAFGSLERTTRWLDLGVATWASGITGSCVQPLCPDAGLRVADINGALLARVPWKDTQVALGLNAYHFRPAPYDSTGASSTTWEAVASAYAIPSRHIQLALTAWLDFVDVDGLYVEATGTIPIALRKSQTPRFFFTATGGWNHGQKTVADGRPVPGYYRRNGFTHVSLEVGWLILHPDPDSSGNTLQAFFRVQGNIDPATKLSAWPLGHSPVDQQLIFGLALHPVLAHPPKPAVFR